MLMKKFFLIAASALMVFASCSKVNINYENDGQPQEIGVFAVNKNMVKGAAEPTSGFPTDYPMLVSAYLVSGTTGTQPGEYFNDIKFTRNNNVWTGGQYWPLSQASINFLAVAPEITGVATTSTPTTAQFSKAATVVVASNETNQYDVMYAVGNGTKEDGQTTNNVQLTFQHALSWINFTVTCGNSGNGAPVITCNSITLNNAYFNGTNTVTANAFNTNSPTVELGTWNTTNASVTETHTVGNTGALVIPKSYTKSNEANAKNLSFTINYTVTQGEKAFTYDYTHVFETVTWDPGKKYTYAVTITLKEITIAPSVGLWDDTDEKGTEEDETDDTPWGSDIDL